MCGLVSFFFLRFTALSLGLSLDGRAFDLDTLILVLDVLVLVLDVLVLVLDVLDVLDDVSFALRFMVRFIIFLLPLLLDLILFIIRRFAKSFDRLPWLLRILAPIKHLKPSRGLYGALSPIVIPNSTKPNPSHPVSPNSCARQRLDVSLQVPLTESVASS